MTPETSIVIRTLNEGKHLEKLLTSICDQNYTDWEIILIDSGSTDNTIEIAERYTSNIYHMRKEDFTFGRSLNIGCSKATGKYLVFVSAHIYPLTNTWLKNLITPFEDPTIGMVYGSQRVGPENSVAEERSLLSNFSNSSHIMINEPAGHNGNSAIRQALWLEHPFDERLTGLEDMAWAKLIQRDDYRVFYSSEARIVHIHEESLKQVYKRFFREALAYKYIFPSYRISRIEAIKMFFHWTIGDVFYCLRNQRSVNKWIRIVPERYLECRGKYNGNHHHIRLKKEFLKSKNTSIQISHDQHVTKSPNNHNILVKLAYVTILKPSFVKATPQDKNLYDNPIHIAFSGIVVGTENKSNRYAIGDKVIGSNISARHINFNSGSISYLDYDSLALLDTEYVRLSESEIQKIPDEITLREGPIVEYLAMCIHILEQIKLNPSRKPCIIGAGLLGSIMAQILSNEGINTTVISSNSIQTQSLWKYDVNTLQDISRLKDFDVLINTTDIEIWTELLTNHRNKEAQIVDIISQISLDSDKQPSVNNTENTVIRLTPPTQSNCDSASVRVTDGRINLSDYTNSVFQINSHYPISEESRPAHNILVEISSDLALV